jgi:hypothetical protein
MGGNSTPFRTCRIEDATDSCCAPLRTCPLHPIPRATCPPSPHATPPLTHHHHTRRHARAPTHPPLPLTPPPQTHEHMYPHAHPSSHMRTHRRTKHQSDSLSLAVQLDTPPLHHQPPHTCARVPAHTNQHTCANKEEPATRLTACL